MKLGDGVICHTWVLFFLTFQMTSFFLLCTSIICIFLNVNKGYLAFFCLYFFWILKTLIYVILIKKKQISTQYLQKPSGTEASPRIRLSSDTKCSRNICWIERNRSFSWTELPKTPDCNYNILLFSRSKERSKLPCLGWIFFSRWGGWCPCPWSQGLQKPWKGFPVKMPSSQ